MASVVVRHLSEPTYRLLKARARKHGRSIEAEIRIILDQAVAREPHRGLGSLLTSIRQETGGVDLDVRRDCAVSEPLDLLSMRTRPLDAERA